MRSSIASILVMITAAFVQTGSAQPFSSLVGAYPDISRSLKALSSFPELLEKLDNEPNVTVFSPANVGFNQSYAKQVFDTAPDVLLSGLQYTIVRGIYDIATLQKLGNSFLPTLLTNETYTNVSGGAVQHVQKDPRSLLRYSGAGDRSDILTTGSNIRFDGGILHITNRIPALPIALSELSTVLDLTAIELLSDPASVPDLNTQTSPDLTFFVPTNAALARYRAANDGKDPSWPAHVVSGSSPLFSTVLTGLKSVESAAKDSYRISVDEDGAVKVGEATVVNPDVLIQNGVVHVIDA
ncbi:MAG: hypothetical protein M1833_001927 [Piccolia ochrophora]|nr:MAG: hypothetical protein M1833_001927 [Piccolia ochrophora]